MPRFTATDRESFISWEWENEESGLIRPHSLTAVLAPERATARLWALLTQNVEICTAGGHIPPDLRPYYEGLLQALDLVRHEFGVEFKGLPPVRTGQADDVDYSPLFD